MRGWLNAIQAEAILTDFPWERYPPRTIVDDVGGGIGNVAMELIKAYPNLQVKLQDLPERIRQAETEVWPKLLPSAITEKRIEFKAMDFLTDSPIEGCDVYYLKNIMDRDDMIQIRHDWPDKECVQILRNIHAVLKPGARVLVHEYVIQHANRTNTESNSGFTEAPKPVLPNYGAGRIRQYNLDLCMWVEHNSKERTLEEFIDIGSKANLQFVKLWHVGEMGVVEFQPA
ncbi:hypothetical protein C0995_004408 [Termitomyces sp. Mi166|nr:hypothetical protein C0995_004408 [Termitomyces sp. Mi166\